METYGFLGLGNLEGNYLCYTIDDGTYQRIEISTTVLNILVKIMNDVILSFQWKGKAYIGPRY